MDIFRQFWETFDFNDLADLALSGRLQEYLLSGTSFGIIAMFALLIAIRPTRYIGTQGAKWTLGVLVYGTSGVALKNSDISQVGPFVLALALGLSIVGYFIWTRLIRQD